MTTNDTPDLAAADLSNIERDVRSAHDGQRARGVAMPMVVFTTFVARRLLSAARLAQKLTELLGPEPVRKAEELLGDSAALRELREDLQLFMDDNHLKFEEAANLAHSRGIELERLRERLAAAEEVCDAALEIRDGGGTLLPELLAVLKTWADREGERVARQFAEMRKP